MISAPDAMIPDALESANREVPVAEKRRRWFEVFLVLLVACGGSILQSVYVLTNGPSALPQMSNAHWGIGIVQELTALLVLGYVLSRRGLRFSHIGLKWSPRGIGVGLLITGLSYGAYILGVILIHIFRYSTHQSWANDPSANDFFAHRSAVMIPFSLLNPFFEELIVRAYLMTEVIELTGSSTLAVALSIAVQFSYHLYYGWVGAISLSFLFLVWALYYVRSRSALPIIVAHGFFDVSALFRLW